MQSLQTIKRFNSMMGEHLDILNMALPKEKPCSTLVLPAWKRDFWPSRRRDHFSVVGLSGGGPYALACAYKIPDRLTTCGVVSGVGPVHVFFFQRFPLLLIPLMWMMGQFFRDEEHARESLTRFTGGWPESDRKSRANSEISAILAASMAESFRQGARGLTYDTLVGEGRPWGFKLEDITFPTIYLWHGEQDKDVPIAMGRAVAGRLPQCQATYYPGEGHVSVIVNHRKEIVTALSS
jgi:pimeloyl-ACP methyl ester carboxylesterase